MEAREPLYKVIHGYKLQLPGEPHMLTIIAWSNGIYLLELGSGERRSLDKVRRIMDLAKPEFDRRIAEGEKISTDNYLDVAKISFGWVSYRLGDTYTESQTLDQIISKERGILNSHFTVEDANSDGRPTGVRAPVKKVAHRVSGKPAVKAIPISVRAARASLSKLQKNGDIHIVNSQVAWQDVKIYFGPFDVAVITDSNADKFQLVSSVGRVSQTASLEEIFSGLPIGPVEFSYQLEPNPLVKHFGQISLNEASNPDFLLKFIQHHVLCSLVMAVVLVSANLLISPSKDHLQTFELNVGQKYFEDVLSYRELLQPHRSKKIGDT